MITELVAALLDAGPHDSDGDGESHLFCCNPDRALCGIDLDEAEYDDATDAPTCVVCADLQAQPVPCSPTCRYPNE